MKPDQSLECVIVKHAEFDKYKDDLMLLLTKLGTEEGQYITDPRINRSEVHNVDAEAVRGMIMDGYQSRWHLLYYADGVPVAMLVGSPGGKDYAANLYYLYIEPDYRKQGLGTIMLDWLFENLEKLSTATTVILGVMVNNTVVTNWYEQYGFKPYHVSMAAPIRRNK